MRCLKNEEKQLDRSAELDDDCKKILVNNIWEVQTMKKLLKTLRTVLLVVLICILAVMMLIRVFGDKALKTAIETAATKALNVPMPHSK